MAPEKQESTAAESHGRKQQEEQETERSHLNHTQEAGGWGEQQMGQGL